jgi:cell division protein FtsX
LDTLLLPAVVGGLAGGAAMYALARRDLGTRRASLAAAATSLALAFGWLFALYGAVLGVVAAILVYAVVRSRIGTGRALLAAGGSYLVIVAGVGALIYASLDTM